MPPRRTIRLELSIPSATIVKVLVAALLTWAALRLWPELVYLTLSLLLAVTLEPAVAWGEERRVPRWVAVGGMAMMLLGLLGIFATLVVPPLIDQLTQIAADFPALKRRVETGLRDDQRVLKRVVNEVLALPESPAMSAQLQQPLVWGKVAVSGLMTGFFVVVTALYLLLDGRRLYAWLLAYVPRIHRDKMAETAPAVSKVIFAYVRGQLITSALFGVSAAILLTVLGVPAAVPLAIFAALCDVIPVIGIILATAPAVALALTVSPLEAGIVAGSYVVYHVFETYFIVPRVYGHSLRLSTLAVLLALIVGGTLQGILGAVLVLPIVAAYPIIERIWLKGYLGTHVIEDHTALAHAAESGSEGAVEAVIQGETPPLPAAVARRED